MRTAWVGQQGPYGPYGPTTAPPVVETSSTTQKAAGGLLGVAGALLTGFGLYYLAPIAGVWLAANSTGSVRQVGSWVANLRVGSVLDYAQARGAVRKLTR